MKAYAALQSASVSSLTIVAVRVFALRSQAAHARNVVAVGEIAEIEKHWRGKLPSTGAKFTASDASFEPLMLEVMDAKNAE